MHKMKVIARSRNEVQLKLYMDRRAYEVLDGYARPLCVSVLDLVRAVLADKFPEAPSEDMNVGPQIEGQRAPKVFTDNRPDVCGRPRCGHSWGSHNYDAQGDELPSGGPCIECALADANTIVESFSSAPGPATYYHREPCGGFV